MFSAAEWAALSFLAGLLGACLWIAWQARGMLADSDLKAATDRARYDAALAALGSKHDLAMAALSRDIANRNFLLNYDLAIADLTKDVRHLKGNLEQHGNIFLETRKEDQELSKTRHEEYLRTKWELDRLVKLVNGKH